MYQILFDEVDVFLETAKIHEKNVWWNYLKRYFGYQCFLGGMFITCMIIYLSPIETYKIFQIDIWYPFSTDPPFNRILIYVVPSVTIFQVLSLFSGDLLIVTLLSYVFARFELLREDFYKIDNKFKLRDCVRRHDKLIGYASAY